MVVGEFRDNRDNRFPEMGSSLVVYKKKEINSTFTAEAVSYAYEGFSADLASSFLLL